MYVHTYICKDKLSALLAENILPMNQWICYSNRIFYVAFRVVYQLLRGKIVRGITTTYIFTKIF